VGTVTIFNGLGNFSENSAFNPLGRRHFDTRIEGYLGDTFNVFRNLNLSIGVNYVRDTGRTDSDLAPIPCSAINTTIVQNPPCTTGFILDQFGQVPANNNLAIPQSLGQRVAQPNLNFAPQAGWPGIRDAMDEPWCGRAADCSTTIFCCKTPIRIASTACRAVNTTAV